MVSSLDGFIAKNDNSVSWFETTSDYPKGADAPDAEAFLETIDCYVMGARTYEHAVALAKTYGWAYGDKPTIVVTHRDLPAILPTIEFYSGGLNELVDDRLKTRYSNAWVVGGAMLAKELISLGLADEIRVSVLPVILGEGTPFFDHIGHEHTLHLKDATAYKTGMVELWYGVNKG